MKRQDFFRIFLFVIIFALLNWVISGWFVTRTRQSFDYQMSVQYMEKMQDQVSVIILGDSHAHYSVKAAEIEGAYNFSSGGESYIFTYYKTRYYLEGGNFHPQLAILPVDLHTFSSFRVDRVEIQDPAFWGRYMNYADYGLETGMLMQMLPTMIKSRLGVAGGLDEFYDHPCCSEPPESVMSLAGYFPASYDESSQFLEKLAEHAEKQTRIQFEGSIYIDKVVLAYFYRLLDLLEEYNVRVVFVWYPVTEFYYDMAGEYILVESHLSTIEGLLANRQPALILDYHDLFFGQHEYFHDSDHLNIHGAEIFTKLLKEDLTEAGVLPVTSVEN